MRRMDTSDLRLQSQIHDVGEYHHTSRKHSDIQQPRHLHSLLGDVVDLLKAGSPLYSVHSRIVEQISQYRPDFMRDTRANETR